MKTKNKPKHEKKTSKEEGRKFSQRKQRNKKLRKQIIFILLNHRSILNVPSD